MKTKIENCNTLDELFELWKTAQAEESDENYNSYKYGNVNKTSFLPEGIIDEEAYSKTDKKILFIAKEANWGGSDKNYNVNEKNDPFWLKSVVMDGLNKTNFSKGIAMLCNAYNSGNFNEPDYNHSCLNNIAFMNLNKRGGYNYSSFKTLYFYTKEYADFIAKEIQIINPDVIICCGSAVEWLMKEFIKIDNTEVDVLGVFHPSYFGVEKVLHLKKLECAIKHEPFEKTYTPDKPVYVKCNRGIIFDTNMTYDEGAVEEMLFPGDPCVAAFGAATRNIELLNIGDTVFYYHRGAGIIAAAEVVGEVMGDKDNGYLKRTVKMLVEPVRTERGYKGLKANADFRNKVKNETLNKRFFLSSTMKVPYLYGDEIQRAVDILNETLKGE